MKWGTAPLRWGWWRLVPLLHRVGGPVVMSLHRRGWWLVVVLAALALELGAVGFERHLLAQGEQPRFPDVLYRAIQLFTLESGSFTSEVVWQLEVARWLAPLVTVGAAARALAMFFYDRFQLFLLRLFGQGHYIVCGLGRKGARLVEQSRHRGEWVVVESNPDNENLARCRELGATVLIGSAANRWVLQQAAVHRAKALISLVGPDGVNVETALPVTLQDSNRNRAAALPTELCGAGYEMKPRINAVPRLVQLTADEIALLAIREHNRWHEERLKDGWRRGPVKDPRQRTHPLLVPWEELPDYAKDFTRAVVRDLPAALAQADFELRKSPLTNHATEQNHASSSG